MRFVLADSFQESCVYKINEVFLLPVSVCKQCSSHFLKSGAAAATTQRSEGDQTSFVRVPMLCMTFEVSLMVLGCPSALLIRTSNPLMVLGSTPHVDHCAFDKTKLDPPRIYFKVFRSISKYFESQALTVDTCRSTARTTNLLLRKSLMASRR